VKLLFDENLSPKLVQLLAGDFPGSVHVHDIGLGGADDKTIWRHAADNGFLIVSKFQRILIFMAGARFTPSRRR
jgi:predicted nuclease of predicted toxin-antitoxin system